MAVLSAMLQTIHIYHVVDLNVICALLVTILYENVLLHKGAYQSSQKRTF